MPEGLSAAETHSHTDASDGMVSAVQLVKDAHRAGLSVLCITDHDTISDSLDAAVELGAQLGIELVKGEEVTCKFPPGIHVVALFIENSIPMHLSVEDTVDAIHDAGGLAIVAHPFMPTWFASMTKHRLRQLLETRKIDGIELRHTAPVLPGNWLAADRFYADHEERIGAAIGAGDSHFGIHDIGRVVTVFPGKTAADLRKAIEQRTASPFQGLSPAGPPMSLRLRQQKRSLLELNLKRMRGTLTGAHN